MILTHLADPDEKELVKAELSKRYYQHYRYLITSSPDQSLSAAASGPEAARSPDGAATTAEESDNGPPPVAGGEPGSPADAGLLAADLDKIAELAPLPGDRQESQSAPPDQSPVKPAPEPAPKKFCFIATAAFGSPLAPEVILLQNFRDAYLCRSNLGRKFIQLYYRLSPPLAQGLGHYRICRFLTRMLLTPLVFFIKKNFRAHPPRPAVRP